MKFLDSLRSRIAALFQRSQINADIEEELMDAYSVSRRLRAGTEG